MSETKENLCSDCGHLVNNHCNPTETNIPGCLQHISVKNCGSQRCPCTRTYESLVGEASTPPELQLLVIDLGDSCVVKVEKGQVILQTLCIPSMVIYDKQAHIVNVPFTELRSAIEQKPVPRIERDDIKIYERYRIYFNNTSYPLPLNVWDAICELVGKPLPIYSEDKWEELIALQSKNEYGNWIDERDFTAWRFTR